MKRIILIAPILISNLFSAEVSDYLNLAKCDKLVDMTYYSSCYSYEHMSALGGWTVLDKTAIIEGEKERPRFYEEESLPEKYRTKYSDYTGFGEIWNRGHAILADADADSNPEKLKSTYSMVNIIPQAALVNQKTWTKVERYGRFTASKLGSLTSVTVVRYDDPSNKLKNKITIPTKFYRIYFNNEAKFEKCFEYGNNNEIDWKKDKLSDHEINCNSIKIIK